MKALKLGPLPSKEQVRLVVTIPMPLKETLDRYAAEYGRTYGQADLTVLIPHMLEAFIRSDRAFRQALRAAQHD